MFLFIGFINLNELAFRNNYTYICAYNPLKNIKSKKMSKRLENKVVVITGGNSGIGLETAKRFVQEGASVFIVGRREVELEKAKAYIGSNVTSITADITSDIDLKRMHDIVKSDKGTIDIIVTSAGITEQADFETTTRAHIEKTFNLNVFGTFFTVQNLL